MTDKPVYSNGLSWDDIHYGSERQCPQCPNESYLIKCGWCEDYCCCSCTSFLSGHRTICKRCRDNWGGKPKVNKVISTKKDIGEVIKLSLIEKGMKVDDLAQKISVSVNTVNSWIKGRSTPGADRFIKIVRALELKDVIFPN